MSKDYKYRTFNVGFYDDLGNEDETQFDIEITPADTFTNVYPDVAIWQDDNLEAVLAEFLGLWEEFRQENYLIKPKIAYVEEVETCIRYRIYQLKQDKRGEYGHKSFHDAERDNGVGSVVIDNYNLVYEFKSDDLLELNEIYDIFTDHDTIPSNFTGGMFGVGDVLEKDGVFWYCDSITHLPLFNDVVWKKLDWE